MTEQAHRRNSLRSNARIVRETVFESELMFGAPCSVIAVCLRIVVNEAKTSSPLIGFPEFHNAQLGVNLPAISHRQRAFWHPLQTAFRQCRKVFERLIPNPLSCRDSKREQNVCTLFGKQTFKRPPAQKGQAEFIMFDFRINQTGYAIAAPESRIAFQCQLDL